MFLLLLIMTSKIGITLLIIVKLNGGFWIILAMEVLKCVFWDGKVIEQVGDKCKFIEKLKMGIWLIINNREAQICNSTGPK